jgi:hypothetical protein
MFFLAVWLFAAFLAQAQLMRLDDLPKPVDVQRYMQPEDIPEWGYPEFRMFGWSPDGKVAWTEVRNIDGRGGTQFHCVIFDAVTDEVVWEVMDDTFDWTEVATDGGEWNTAWSHIGARFEAAMARFGIALNEGVELLPLPAGAERR